MDLIQITAQPQEMTSPIPGVVTAGAGLSEQIDSSIFSDMLQEMLLPGPSTSCIKINNTAGLAGKEQGSVTGKAKINFNLSSAPNKKESKPDDEQTGQSGTLMALFMTTSSQMDRLQPQTKPDINPVENCDSDAIPDIPGNEADNLVPGNFPYLITDQKQPQNTSGSNVMFPSLPEPGMTKITAAAASEPGGNTNKQTVAEGVAETIMIADTENTAKNKCSLTISLSEAAEQQISATLSAKIAAFSDPVNNQDVVNTSVPNENAELRAVKRPPTRPTASDNNVNTDMSKKSFSASTLEEAARQAVAMRSSKATVSSGAVESREIMGFVMSGPVTEITASGQSSLSSRNNALFSGLTIEASSKFTTVASATQEITDAEIRPFKAPGQSNYEQTRRTKPETDQTQSTTVPFPGLTQETDTKSVISASATQNQPEAEIQPLKALGQLSVDREVRTRAVTDQSLISEQIPAKETLNLKNTDASVGNLTGHAMEVVFTSTASREGTLGKDEESEHKENKDNLPSSSITSTRTFDMTGPNREEHLSNGEKTKIELHENIMAQVREGVIHHDGKGNGQMTVKLNPSELGEIQVNVRVEDQRVKVEVISGNRTVREALMGNLEALKETLTKQHLNMDGFTVTTGGGNGFSQPFKEERGNQWNGSRMTFAQETELPDLHLEKAGIIFGDAESSLVDLRL